MLECGIWRSSVEAARCAPDEVIGANLDYVDQGGGGPVLRRQVLTPTALTSGNVAAMPLWAGESVNFVTSRQPAAEIVRDLVNEAALLLPSYKAP